MSDKIEFNKEQQLNLDINILNLQIENTQLRLELMMNRRQELTNELANLKASEVTEEAADTTTSSEYENEATA